MIAADNAAGVAAGNAAFVVVADVAAVAGFAEVAAVAGFAEVVVVAGFAADGNNFLDPSCACPGNSLCNFQNYWRSLSEKSLNY